MQQLTGLKAAAADIAEVRTARRATGDRFFVIMGGLMLLLTAVGFAPTFFLKPLFDAPQLPFAGLVISGLVCRILRSARHSACRCIEAKEEAWT